MIKALKEAPRKPLRLKTFGRQNSDVFENKKVPAVKARTSYYT